MIGRTSVSSFLHWFEQAGVRPPGVATLVCDQAACRGPGLYICRGNGDHGWVSVKCWPLKRPLTQYGFCSMSGLEDEYLETLAFIFLVSPKTQYSDRCVYVLGHVQLFATPWTIGSSVHGISQARILEWIAISYSRRSSRPGNWTQISSIGRRILYHCTTWEAQWVYSGPSINTDKLANWLHQQKQNSTLLLHIFWWGS